MDFPTDDVLIARGKYSTLGKERRAQLERVQRICTLITTEALKVLRDCERIPPVDASHVATLETCLENIQDARQRVSDLCADMQTVKVLAWPD